MTRNIKNIPASVLDRLRNKARESGYTFSWLLQNYVNERFLYRLAQSRHCEKFVLKGGLIFIGWRLPLRRHTRDIDLRAYTENTEANISQIMKDVCNQPVEPDGVQFDPSTITTEIITERAEYPGIRAHLWAYIGERTRERVQIDIGFSDEITPHASLIDYPTVLDLPGPQLMGYSKETVVAEKLHAILFQGRATSRFKDFYDLWFMGMNFDFEEILLQTAIGKTFKNRNFTTPTKLPYVLSNDYAQNHETQWRAFLRNFVRSEEGMPNFTDILQILRNFLLPVLESSESETMMDTRWNAGDRWIDTDS